MEGGWPLNLGACGSPAQTTLLSSAGGSARTTRNAWRVEEDFIDAILQGGNAYHSDDGVLYMQFTEIIQVNLRGRKVALMSFSRAEQVRSTSIHCWALSSSSIGGFFLCRRDG